MAILARLRVDQFLEIDPDLRFQNSLHTVGYQVFEAGAETSAFKSGSTIP